MCRDSYVGIALLLFRVGVHEIRGKSKDRFMNLSDPVQVTYKSTGEEGLEQNKMNRIAARFGAKMQAATIKADRITHGKVKAMDIQSGFLVEEKQEIIEDGVKQAVYSDHIA
jgi:hypothetical protein